MGALLLAEVTYVFDGTSVHPTGWMRDDLVRRKELLRRLWAGLPLDHVPVHLQVVVPPGSSALERHLSAERQLEAGISSAMATWHLAPSSDAIPCLFPDMGCSCLATSFGGDYFWGDDPQQTPGVAQPIITDLERQVVRLPDPDPWADGLLPEGLRRIRLFADAGADFLPVTLMDMAGGLNVAADLLGMTDLLLALYTAPDALHLLLAKVQRLFLATIRAAISAAGGEERIANTDFLEVWFPEGHKAHVSDDVSSSIGPVHYAEFSAPYHALVFGEFGRGGLHNCGPHPCRDAYLALQPAPRAVDVEDRYSHRDLSGLRHSLKGRGFLLLGWDGAGDPSTWFADVMDQMAPDVAVVPVLKVAPEDQPELICQRLHPIAVEYARRMAWGWLD